MIILFVCANSLYISIAENIQFSIPRVLISIIIIASAFFRLRLFDEIKDYDVDVLVNPLRPLARGLLKISQVRAGIAVLLLTELSLAAYLGFWPFVVHFIAVSYSLFMFEEFFIGDLLRPYLTTYAVTHTFVSTLFGLSAAVLTTGLNPLEFNIFHYTFFLSNWAFFNLFEFARKTYSPAEEKNSVPSYSKIFSPLGAWFLTISQALIGIFLVWSILRNPFFPARDLSPLLFSFGFFFLFSLPYIFKSQERQAYLFRSSSAVYLLFHYAILVAIFGSKL